MQQFVAAVIGIHCSVSNETEHSIKVIFLHKNASIYIGRFKSSLVLSYIYHSVFDGAIIRVSLGITSTC